MKKKQQKFKGNLALTLICVIIGAISGVIMAIYLDSVFEEYGFLPSLLFKTIIFLITYFLQLIIHEFGHLVAGLLSGYSFGSFRIGSLMIVNNDGKLKIKHQSVAGTGGQCLMIPPKPVDGKIPVIFYNLGGVFMNFITLPICVYLIRFLIGKPVLYCGCVMMFLSGLIVVLTNGIPLKLGMINNDGSNTVELYHNKEAMASFYNQFMILEFIRNGKRLKEIPVEYFPMPTKEGMKNSISASSAVFLENRLFDAKEFDEALSLINELLSTESALIGLHKNFLLADKITIQLLRGENDRARNLYLDQNYQKFAKQMKTSINIIRTDYAYALLCEGNEKKASEILLHFNKCAQRHPYNSDVESERELISLIDDAFNKFG